MLSRQTTAPLLPRHLHVHPIRCPAGVRSGPVGGGGIGVLAGTGGTISVTAGALEGRGTGGAREGGGGGELTTGPGKGVPSGAGIAQVLQCLRVVRFTSPQLGHSQSPSAGSTAAAFTVAVSRAC